MKSIKSYLSMAAVALMALGSFTACQDDFDTPPLIVPEATIEPNTTIAELKEKYWSDDNNYYITIEPKEDGSKVIVSGRVISSDASGNIYKSLVIQDATGAMAFSVNQNSLYNTYRIGQEVVIDVTGLGIGKYAGLQQIGGYGEYNGTPQVSFMAYELFEAAAQLNGLPKTDYVYLNSGETPTDGVMYCKEADMGNLPTTPAGQREWQSQLVIFRNVHFQDGGVLNYSDEDASVNRTLLDENGNSIILRNSNYASFKNDLLPSGIGDVMGILSYYNGTWQVLIRTTADCMFDSKGQLDDPYTVAEAIEEQGKGVAGWVEAYIVGSLKANATNPVSDDNVIWSSDAEMDNTLVIGATADTKSLSEALVVELPQGSDFRKYANLIDNKGVYQKKIWVRGTFDKFMGVNGIVGNKGTTSEFKIDGVNTGGQGDNPSTPTTVYESYFCDFEGFEKKIANVKTQGWNYVHTSGDKDWYLNEFDSNVYAAATAYKGNSGPWDQWLISPGIDLDKSPKKTLEFKTQAAYQSTTSYMEVYLLTSNDPSTATKTKLEVTLPEIPASGYSQWVTSNVDLSAYSGVVYIGWRYYGTSASGSSTYCIDDVNIGGANATTTPDEPEPEPDPTGLGSAENPYKISDVMNSTADATGVWIEGYVVGWVNGMVWSSGATFDNNPGSDYTNTNCILADSADVTSTASSIPAGIKAGATRDILGLKSNPDIYKKHVKVYGDVTRYFGLRGVKNISKVEIIE